MSTLSLREAVPTWAVAAVAALMALTLVYTVLVAAEILAWVLGWAVVFGVGLLLVVVWLLYRLVMAAERIADRA